MTKDNYKMLSRFFDGVPVPVDATDAPADGQPRKETIVSVHPPYAQEKCDECHNTGKRLNKESSALCLKCHEKIPTEYPRMHGPVAAVACLWCHSPHDASQPHLIKEPDRKLCMQCHTSAILDASRVPAHAEESRACLECHFGHGGTERYQLRPGKADNSKAPAEK
ncbi:MAG: hypothetical protein JSR77_05385 [Planctomycetes bacterium]|nr:hypothetical protein [Planctomycetota bacterium]